MRVFLFAVKAAPCICSDYKIDINTAYSKYNFIAFLKNIKKSALDGADTVLIKDVNWKNNYEKITVEIIKRYKGKQSIMILE
jgi:hypothetical protein